MILTQPIKSIAIVDQLLSVAVTRPWFRVAAATALYWAHVSTFDSFTVSGRRRGGLTPGGVCDVTPAPLIVSKEPGGRQGEEGGRTGREERSGRRESGRPASGGSTVDPSISSLLINCVGFFFLIFGISVCLWFDSFFRLRVSAGDVTAHSFTDVYARWEIAAG